MTMFLLFGFELIGHDPPHNGDQRDRRLPKTPARPGNRILGQSLWNDVFSNIYVQVPR